jgi:hypothetical protein
VICGSISFLTAISRRARRVDRFGWNADVRNRNGALR